MGGGIPALVATGTVAATQKSAEGNAQGRDPLLNTIDSTAQGFFEAAFEQLGTLSVVKKIEASIVSKFGKDTWKKIGADVTKQLLAGSLQEGAEESGNSLAQSTSSYFTGGNPDLTLTDVAKNALNAGIVGAASSGPISGPFGALGAYQRGAQMKAAQRLVEFHTALGESAKESKLRARLPEAHQKLVENLTKDGPVQDVHIPVEAFESYFQSKNLEPAAAAQQFGFGPEFTEAKQTGSDVKVPLGKFVNQLVDTEHYQGLANDIKYSPESMTFNEARVDEKDRTAALKLVNSEATVEESKPEAELTPDELAVRQAREIKRQLKQELMDNPTLKYGSPEADASAAQFAAFIYTSAQRSGQTPMDLFNRYVKTKLLGDGQAVVGQDVAMAAQDQVLNQSANPKTDSPEFKNWFQASKVVDESGAPLVVYHGTDQKIEAFKHKRSADGFYFTSNKSLAKDYAKDSEANAVFAGTKATVYPTYLSMQNPLVVDGSDGSFDFGGESHDRLIEQAKVNGHDGVIIKNTQDDITDSKRGRSDTYIAFDSTQIKSTKNNGKFDPKDPRILFQSAAQAIADQYPADPAPPTFSKLIQTVEQKMGGSADPQQIRAMLKDVKEEEKKWLGLEEFLKDKEKVKKQDLLDFLRANEPEIVDVTKDDQVVTGLTPEENARMEELYQIGDTRTDEQQKELLKIEAKIDSNRTKIKSTQYKQYTLPGGENYREVLFTLPEAAVDIDARTSLEGRLGKLNDDWEVLRDEVANLRNEIIQEFTKAGNEDSFDVVKERAQEIVLNEGNEDDLRAFTVDFAKKKAPDLDSSIVNDYIDARKRARALELEREQLRKNIASFKSESTYKSSHFDEKNVLAHTRLTDRIDADGKKVLFVEEIQSDWHQEGRKKGYTSPEDADLTELPDSIRIEETPASETGALSFGDQDPNRTVFNVWDGPRRLLSGMPSRAEAEEAALRKLNRERQTDKVPDAPFKKTWHEYAMKRIVRMAAEGGYDRIAWTTGSQQNERFKLSKFIDRIQYSKSKADPSKYNVIAYDKNGKDALGGGMMYGKSADEIETLLGKDIAQKIVNDEGDQSELKNEKVLRGLNLEAGGEGMKGFYDKILVDYAKKFGKKFGATVGETTLDMDMSGKSIEDAQVHSLDVTDKMKEVALGQGFELFQSGRQPIPMQTEFEMPEVVRKIFGSRSDGATNVVQAAGNKAKEEIQGKEFQNQQTGWSIAIPAKGIKKALGSRRYDQDATATAIENLDDVIQKSIYWGTEVDRKDRKDIESVHAFYAPIQVDDRLFVVRLKVRETSSGKKFYDSIVVESEIQKNERPVGISEPTLPSEDGRLRTSAFNEPDSISIDDFLNELKAIRAKYPLFQSDASEAGPLGRIVISSNKTMQIDLFKGANLSTFLHETGHFYFEVLRDLSKDPRASAQLKADYQTVKDWLGETDESLEARSKEASEIMDRAKKEGRELTRAEESRVTELSEPFEKWARGFELYLARGEAPTSELRAAFASFKVWLSNIYKNLLNLRVELNDDIKGVMDRLLATDEQLAEAVRGQPSLLDNPTSLSLTPAQYEEYKKLENEEKRAASEELTAKVLKHEMQKREAAYKEARKEVRSRVESEANQMQVYKALAILQKGTQPDGSPLPQGVQAIKLDRQSIVDAYGKEFLDRLPRPYVYAKEGGIHFNAAAEMLGYESGDAMLKSLADMPSKKDYIERETDREMDVRFPDEVMDKFPEEAVKAAHADPKRKRLYFELSALAEKSPKLMKGVIQKVVARVPREADVKAQAIQMIGAKKIQDVKPYVFERAERKAAREAGVALSKGDIAGAFEAKRKELLNYELYKAAVEAQEQVESANEFFKKFRQKDDDLAKARDTNLINVGRAILAAYGLGKTDKTSAEYLKSMKSYDPEGYKSAIAIIENSGLTPGRYDEVSFDEFTAMHDTVKALWDLSKQSDRRQAR